MYINDPYEPRYQSLVIKRDDLGLFMHCADQKYFVEYSSDMNDAYKKKKKKFKPGAKWKALAVFDDMTEYMISE